MFKGFAAILILAAGVFYAAPLRANSGNLLQNGGFETGNFKHWTAEGVGLQVALSAPYQGKYDAQFLVPGGQGYNTFSLSQTFADLAGDTVDLSWRLRHIAVRADPASTVEVLVDGRALWSLTDPDLAKYASFNIDFVATGRDTIEFLVYSQASVRLDDVVADEQAGQNVPEPATIGVFAAALVGLGSLLRLRPRFGRDFA